MILCNDILYRQKRAVLSLLDYVITSKAQGISRSSLLCLHALSFLLLNFLQPPPSYNSASYYIKDISAEVLDTTDTAGLFTFVSIRDTFILQLLFLATV